MMLIVAFLLLIVVWIDFAKRKIPNPLVIFLFLFLFIYQLFINDSVALYLYGISFVLTFILFFSLYLVRFLGAGDVKLIAALALTFAFPHIIQFWLLLIIFTLLFSLIHVIKHRGWKRIQELFYLLLSGSLWKNTRIEKEGQELKFPYSIVIVSSWGGTILWLGI